jgi:hypothetical protein
MNIIYYILDTKILLILTAVCIANEIINWIPEKKKARSDSTQQ